MTKPAADSSAAQRCAAPPALGRPEAGESVAVPQQARFEGLLSFEGAVCVEGTLRGAIYARGRLRIGPRADVEGQIEVDELIIEGRVRGPLRARARVVLTRTADVEGELHAPRVELHDGSRFSGPCCSGAKAQVTAATSRENPPFPS